ncbi:MAG: hypothetical protein M3313_04745 [Actinomycetota bacterium]|nr:hypothetical protein [Actinomycetota bacterium]
MTEPPTPAEVMLGATKATLRTGRVGPAQVVKQQLDALTAAGYRLSPEPGDGGSAMLLATAKRAFWSGRFRPAEVIAVQLGELAAAGFYFDLRNGQEGVACDEFAWGPDSFESCAECGLSFWRHGEGDPQDSRSQQG